MKKNFKMNNLANIILIISGFGIIAYQWFGNPEVILLFYIVLGLIMILNLIIYLTQKEKKDKESLYIAVASFFIPFVAYLNFPNSKMLLPISMLTWVGLMSIVKLIRLDYLHDRKMPIFKIEFYSLILFIIMGVTTTYSLYFDYLGQAIIIGFFIIIISIIDLFKDRLEISLQIEKKLKTKKVKNENHK